MMISNFYITMIYLASLLLFFNYNNPIFFWMLMEINLISFIMILYLNKGMLVKQDSMNYVLFYFLIQSAASILFLSNFSFLEWVSIFNYDMMFITSLILKIGLFPLFFWIFSFSQALSILPLICLLSLQKVPLLCGLYFSDSCMVLILLFFSFIFGSILLLYSFNILYMFLCSSFSYGFLMFFLYTSSIFLFLTFFLMYSIFLYFCLSFLKDWTNNSGKDLFILVSSYSFFLGLPPLGLFFYKFIFAGIMYMSLGYTEVFFFWLFSILALFGYLKFFFSSFFSFNYLYYKPHQTFLMNTLFFFLIFCSYFFFIF